jgi:integrase/recombinase XerC
MLPLYQPYLQQFLNYLRFEKRYSQHTVLSYQNDLEQFFAYLSADFDGPDVPQITSGIIRSWMASLKEENYTAKSINRKISTLRTFFKKQLKDEVIKQSPLTTIVTPKIAKRLPVFAPEADMKGLLAGMRQDSALQGGNERQDQAAAYNNPVGASGQGRAPDMEPQLSTLELLTHRLIISIFYYTGMRLSELVNLKERQVDVYYNQLKVLGKGNKERIIPVSAGLMKEIQEYIAGKPGRGGEEAFLLVNKKGKPFSSSAMRDIVKKYLGQIPTLEKTSPHVLRHTFATHLMNNGADLNAVKELLGHSSLASTQVYTHNTIEKLREIYHKAHPKA